MYGSYVNSVGDPNDNYRQDANEPEFVRHRAEFGQIETIGKNDNIEIRVLSVRGDTEGTANDIDRSIDDQNRNENPGSIALLIRLDEFEFYTAGDQTDNDWKSEPPVEESLVASGAIPNGDDIDVIKVNRHGSDTSTAANFVTAIDPEVALISTRFGAGDRLPKKIVIQQFNDNRSYVLITGDGTDPATDEFTASIGDDGDETFTPDASATFNAQGNLTVLVSTDGARYTVMGDSFARTFSSVDANNVH